VGLGAGSTRGYLFRFLKPQIENDFPVQLVTSSFSTRQLLLKNKFVVQPISSFKNIDVYLDGCDQLAHKLKTLKSGAGIHTSEKLLASMASQFVLIGDESKLVENVDTRFPSKVAGNGFVELFVLLLRRGFVAPSDKLLIAGVSAGGKGGDDDRHFAKTGKAELLFSAMWMSARQCRTVNYFPKQNFIMTGGKCLKKSIKISTQLMWVFRIITTLQSDFMRCS
jgi:hypothetical protein